MKKREWNFFLSLSTHLSCFFYDSFLQVNDNLIYKPFICFMDCQWISDSYFYRMKLIIAKYIGVLSAKLACLQLRSLKSWLTIIALLQELNLWSITWIIKGFHASASDAAWYQKKSIDYFKCMSLKRIYPLGASLHYLVPGGIRISYHD